MKKTAKVLLAFALILVSLMSTTAFAVETFEAVEPTFEVLVNDENFYSDPPVVVIDGRTYLPLRALGDCLGVYVEWNGELGQVEVRSTKKPAPSPSALENGYVKFKDIPNFAKCTGYPLLRQQPGKISLGYIYSYGYFIEQEHLTATMDAYMAILAECGFEKWRFDETPNSSAQFMLNKTTGRMMIVQIQGGTVWLSVLRKTRSAEDWTLLNEGKTIPQKKFNAVTAGFKVMVNGKEFVSENPAMVINDRTYLPLRAMGDCLGVFVDWDEETKTVIVNSNQ